VIPKEQSTRFEDIVIEGGGVSIKGSLEVDQNADLLNANFPTYSPSEGDKASLKAERGPDGVIRVTMRGDVFDGRGFLKSAISGTTKDESKSKPKGVDLDIDLRLGAVAGYNGEALRSVDLKFSRRNGVIKNFALNGKIGRDTPVSAELKPRGQGIGRALLSAAESWARAQGCREMASDADIANALSQRVHEASGFTAVGRSVLYRKSL